MLEEKLTVKYFISRDGNFVQAEPEEAVKHRHWRFYFDDAGCEVKRECYQKNELQTVQISDGQVFTYYNAQLECKQVLKEGIVEDYDEDGNMIGRCKTRPSQTIQQPSPCRWSEQNWPAADLFFC
jgi:hypothetical protein